MTGPVALELVAVSFAASPNLMKPQGAPPRASLFDPVWRSALLVPFAVVLIAKTLAAFAAIIQPYLAITYDLWFELGMVIGQVLFQWGVLLRRPWPDKRDYAFVLIAVSSLGAALLWPLLAWHHLQAVAPLAAVIYFFGVVAIMFAAHWRLVKRLELPTVLCATWVVYRLLILVVVVKRP